MKYRCVLFILIGSLLDVARIQAGELSLDAFSDGDSTYYEYISDGFFRMDLYSPNQPTHQSLHSISNPSLIYNENFDGFPHDRIFRFGSVTFDESGLVNGTGTAPITDLTLSIATDPNDSGYLNWRRFTANTLVSSSSGSIDLVDGVPVSVALTADLQLEIVTPLGSTENGYYPGTFTIDGARFSFEAEGHQVMDLIFGNDLDVHLRWDFAGALLALPPSTASPADYDHNGSVDDIDHLLWRNVYGSSTHWAADGNGDGTIDAADYVAWRKFYDAAGAGQSGTSVPEPAAVSCVALATAWILLRRRERAT